MIYAYVDGIYCPLFTLKITRAINNAGSCTFDCPISMFKKPYEDYRNCEYSVYYKDTKVMFGLIESSSFSIGEDNIVDSISFSGIGELGLLAKIGAKSDAFYEDANPAFILDDLLTRAPNWRLGYMKGFDFSASLSVDLRTKESLLGQITELINLLPNNRFRYGGTRENKYLLDVGTLDDINPTPLIQGVNIESARKIPQSKKMLYQIEAYGGKAGLTDLSLYNATLMYPNLLTDPEFRIVQENGNWLVRHIQYPKGDTVIKRYQEIHPVDQDTPLPFFVQKASYALYLAAKNELIKANSTSEKYEIKGTVELGAVYD